MQFASNRSSHGFCHSGQSSAEILSLGATLPYFCCRCAPQEDWMVLGSEGQSRPTFYHDVDSLVERLVTMCCRKTCSLVRNNPLMASATQAARRCDPNQHSHGNSYSEQHPREIRAWSPAQLPDLDNFLKTARRTNHNENIHQKAHRGHFEALAVVEHFWLIV